MADDVPPTEARFRPLRPASGPVMTAAFIAGPPLWLIAFAVVAWIADRSNAIAAGMLIATVSFVVSAAVLFAFHKARLREVRRYESRR